MRVLIAEDDAVSRRMLQRWSSKWGFEPVMCSDGIQAWRQLEKENAPDLVVLDWMMPGMDGLELCRKIRERESARPVYIILLTAKDQTSDIVAGLEAGADDYITKPFHHGELRARIQVGARVLELQRSLADRVKELEDALSQVRQLRGLLPICSYCKKIRNDENYWQQVETYISEHSAAKFSHGICPDCYQNIVVPEMEEFSKEALDWKKLDPAR